MTPSGIGAVGRLVPGFHQATQAGRARAEDEQVVAFTIHSPPCKRKPATTVVIGCA